MMSMKPFRAQPRVSRVVCEEEEYPCIDGYDSACGISNIAGEESSGEGIFSDDTGFYSALSEEEAVGDTETGEEEDATNEYELYSQVEQNYTSLVQKYTDKGFVDSVKDAFDKQVNYDEIRMVLKLSIKPCNWQNFVVPALLLDTITRIWVKQVTQAKKDTDHIVEMITYRNKTMQKERSKRMTKSSASLEDADEGYTSQPMSQQSQDQPELDMMAEDDRDDDGEKTVNRRFRRSKKFIAASNDHLTNDFVAELSATVVSRRKFLHERCRQMVQDPYLDHQFDMLAEYYNDIEYEGPEKIMADKSDSLGQSAKHLIKGMKKITREQEMNRLEFPFLRDDDDDDNGEEESINEAGAIEPMEVDDLNNENIEPLPPLFPIASLQEQGESLEEQRENLAVDILAVPEGIEEGENVPPPKTKEKRKRKKRTPLLEKQNINGEEGTAESEAKRPRLDNEEAAAELEQNREQLQHQQSMEGYLSTNDFALVLFSDSSTNDEPGLLNNADFGHDDVDNSGSNIDLTTAAAECDDIFHPPSLLFQNNDSSSAITNLTSRSQVDMSAIKSKFSDIIQQSFRSDKEKGHSPITFVQILQKSEMDIVVGPNETISQPNRNSVPALSSSSSTNKCSVGVAFLAMLHNASREKFFLLEDTEGAFKVTRDEPVDDVGSCDGIM